MSDRLLTLWLMPGPWPGSTQPDPDGFADVVRSALTVERRAAQGFLQQEDVRRDTTASIAIERIARIRGTPVATISASAIDAFRASAAAPGRADRVPTHPPKPPGGCAGLPRSSTRPTGFIAPAPRTRSRCRATASCCHRPLVKSARCCTSPHHQ